jgi:hypothetical protein
MGTFLALLTGSSTTSQNTVHWLPLAFSALAGAVAGYLLKTCTDLIIEHRRADREFRAAALLVSDELQANIVKLKIALETTEDPEPLAIQTYHAYQLILARRLSSEARDAVRGAYIHARVPRAFQVRSGGGERVGSTPVVEDALDKSRRARELLRKYIPEGTAEI